MTSRRIPHVSQSGSCWVGVMHALVDGTSCDWALLLVRTRMLGSGGDGQKWTSLPELSAVGSSS